MVLFMMRDPSGYCTRMMRAQAGYGGTLYDENAVLLLYSV
jgi:hypothetical protein